MTFHPIRTIDRFRQPEYTGENRCIPCTTVNVAIAVLLSAAVYFVNPYAAIAVFALSLAAIYLRGYLVPKTPTLTKRYFPDWLLAKFDKAPFDEYETVFEQEEGQEIDTEQVLLDLDVVEPCADEDDLCLSDDFREQWYARIDELVDQDRVGLVAEFLEVDPDRVRLRETKRDHFHVLVDSHLAGRWESKAAVIADIAADRTLQSITPSWDRLDLPKRSEVVSGLRTFLDYCPDCGGQISIGENTVESCCRSRQVYAVTCEDCETWLLEVPQ